MVNTKVGSIESSLRFVLDEALDPWDKLETSTVVRELECLNLEPVSDFYYIPEKHYCMVLGDITHCYIICAHIWPKATIGRGLDQVGLAM